MSVLYLKEQGAYVKKKRQTNRSDQKRAAPVGHTGFPGG